jgi:polygalacturonase
MRQPNGTTGKAALMAIREPASINDLRTAIRELSIRADLAHKEGRHDDAAEIEQRIQGYREELSQRP